MGQKKDYPSLSIVIPTLNSIRTLEECLKSISSQNYPGKVEIVIADGGSNDGSLKIAGKYGARVIKNLLKTGEAGKAVGAKQAKGEILGFVDSDNILTSKDWLKRIVEPLVLDQRIIASEPLYFQYNSKRQWLTRYFALLGMGDPLNLFLGNYDHYSFVSNKWTEMKLKVDKNKDYLVLHLSNELPTVGANGFFIRKEWLNKYPYDKYLFDIDVLRQLTKTEGELRMAKVKVGIEHLFSGNIRTFIRKQKRRIRDFLYYNQIGLRHVEQNKVILSFGFIKFVLATITIIPLFIQSVLGFIRKRDVAWLFHPLACLLTLFVYSFETIRFVFIKEEFNRNKWKQ